MAFCVTYQCIQNYNIRNLYGGLPTEIKWRTPNFCPVLTPAKRIHDEQRLPPDRFEVKFYEYNREYDIKVPKAPAFQVLSRKEVQEIVDRVYQPIPRRQCKRVGSSHSEEDKSGQRPNGSPTSYQSKSSRSLTSAKSYSQSDLEAITNRVSKATVASDIRVKMRNNVSTPLPDLVKCWKVENPVHMRYKLRHSSSPTQARLTFIEKTLSMDEETNSDDENTFE
ncbi:hypothetical protein CHS0354_022542 [Potamilus streckersoni]|uniref:Uncharacterized protein n=1 Tax=Potamilus streckersoni TaxID=2493646 RepID=A0AAE0WBE6_9BIVA|nr:hypothetical protein CHS0354_022542 [Potamilus streckersoni]